MRAEIIAVGTELLLGQIANTNGQYLSQKLAEVGIDVYYHTCVGDNFDRIIEILDIAYNRSDLIILTGGLGPTDDDITKDAVATYLNLSLLLDEVSALQIKQFFLERQIPMPERNLNQAMLPEGSIALENCNGTAPGVFLAHNEKYMLLLPGPPRELQPMFSKVAIPKLLQFIQKDSIIHSLTLRFFGVGESRLVDIIDDILISQTNPTIAPLCSDQEVTLRITAKAGNVKEAQELIEPVRDLVINRLHDYYYGTDEQSLLSLVHARLLQQGYTISVAESCTGGLLSNMLSTLADSSRYFMQGFVCYSNAAKISFGVPEQLIEEAGAVSAEVSTYLAKLARGKHDTNIGIGITGYAGPTSDFGRNVGEVFIAIDADDYQKIHKFQFNGNRDSIRMKTVKTVLFLLLKHMESKGE
ncbi:competence/damage-inducible protein A [Desulfuribacillus stibiiarsenatis]|uniref:Putative competence-damage inducible protein n=1 Tax=Desulfuribacillus stibiiarsenatis TaxID=1390249 RepID=A0A1E5L761_9FIRM|nr:competence/damage-inducible protein A [Desulfuribacillus stibiiarsenatis]OEH85888.1 competence/damage-inducible protein A [Desulfuribacillus stibiiarsenatis]